MVEVPQTDQRMVPGFQPSSRHPPTQDVIGSVTCPRIPNEMASNGTE